jgi:hypothetical protein
MRTMKQRNEARLHTKGKRGPMYVCWYRRDVRTRERDMAMLQERVSIGSSVRYRVLYAFVIALLLYSLSICSRELALVSRQ